MFCTTFKVVSAVFLLFYFVSLKDSTCETRKNVFFISLQKLFSFLRYQILTFQIFRCHDVIKCLWMKHETFYWIIWKEKFGNEILLFYVILQMKIFYQNILWKIWALFYFQKVLCKKEFEEVCMLILTNFDTFGITYLI